MNEAPLECYKSHQINKIGHPGGKQFDYITKNSVSHDVRINIRMNRKRQCCLDLGLMHPFLGMHDGVEHSMSVD